MKDYSLTRQFNALRIFGVTAASFERKPKARRRAVQDAEAIFASYAFRHLRDERGMLKLDAYAEIAEYLRLAPISVKPCIDRFNDLVRFDKPFRARVAAYEKELARLDRRARENAQKALHL